MSIVSLVLPDQIAFELDILYCKAAKEFVDEIDNETFQTQRNENVGQLVIIDE